VGAPVEGVQASRRGQGFSCEALLGLGVRYQCSRALVLPTRIGGVWRVASVAAASARIGGVAPLVESAAAEFCCKRGRAGAHGCAVFALLYYGGAATTVKHHTGAAAAAETTLHGEGRAARTGAAGAGRRKVRPQARLHASGPRQDMRI
jgi:hypothetical protein